MTDTNTDHTPEPWAYEEKTGRIYFADGDVEPTIAFVEIDNTSPEQARADGHLLAASPKLLKAVSAALQRMADIYRDTFDSRMDHDPLVIELRAAIHEADAPGIPSEPAAVPITPTAEDRYAGSTEIVPGVFLDPGAAIYIADRQGEVVSWNHDEIAADPSGFTAAIAAVAIATKYGASAVRENIDTGGAILARLAETTGRQS